jgi:hypothetical protein
MVASQSSDKRAASRKPRARSICVNPAVIRLVIRYKGTNLMGRSFLDYGKAGPDRTTRALGPVSTGCRSWN